jgi:SAM-dependent methyltransferase
MRGLSASCRRDNGVIPNIRDLRSSFATLLENSGAFSPAERREAVLRMFSARGYEWSFLCPADPAKRAFLIPAPWSITPLILAGRFAELVVWEPEPRRAELLRHFYKDLRLPVRVLNGPLDRLADHTERYGVVALEDSFAHFPDRVPEDVIRWAARLLEPDGQCCVVTASRLGRSTFKGDVVSVARRVRQLLRDSHPLPSWPSARTSSIQIIGSRVRFLAGEGLCLAMCAV